MKAMILAAGRGERMRPLTDERPKVLIEFGGKPLVHYHLESLAHAGITEVVINTSWLAEQIPAALGDGSRWGLSISYSDEGHPPLETGGGILRALDMLGGQPFLVVNGDIWTDFPFEELIAETLDRKRDLARLVLVDNPAHNLAGDFALSDGRLVSGPGKRLTYSGIGIYSPAMFERQAAGAFPLAPLLNAAVDNDQVSATHFCGEWRDIGTPARLAELDASLNRA